MKKQVLKAGILGILLVFGTLVAGCPNDTKEETPTETPKTTGSITVRNNSNTYKIEVVDIYDVVTDQSIKIDADGIDKGKSKTFEVDPNDKLQVWIEDSAGDTYRSPQFILRAGDSRSFTYDGFGIQ